MTRGITDPALWDAALDMAASEGVFGDPHAFTVKHRMLEYFVQLQAAAGRMRAALEEIASIDYRGHPHESARIAKQALGEP